MRQKSIDEVLLLIQDAAASNRVFSLRFVRATGERKGSVKFVAKARYGAPERERLAHDVRKTRNGAYSMTNDNEGKERKVSLHVDNGTLPLTDIEANKYFTPIIRLIIGYNDCVVTH
jgi:hypothetical protein